MSEGLPRFVRSGMFVVGVGLIVATPIVTVLHRDLVELRSTQLVVFVSYNDHKDCSGGVCPAAVNNIGQMEFDIQCPARATERESVLVTLHAHFKPDKDGKRRKFDNDDPSILRQVIVELSGSGLLIDPKDKITLSPNGVAQWSVRGTSTGDYKLVLNATVPASAVFLDLENTSINLKIVPSTINLAEHASSFVMGFLGSLMTLPGILAYLEARRKRKTERSTTDATP